MHEVFFLLPLKFRCFSEPALYNQTFPSQHLEMLANRAVTSLKLSQLMSLPMLRVTVMIFRDMVESVMLLKDDDWKTERKGW